MNKKAQIVPITIVVAIVFLLLGIGITYYTQGNSCKDIKQVLYYEELEYEIADQSADIYDDYSTAMAYYDTNDFDKVILYCEKSRDLSSSYSQKLRQIKAKYPENPIEILSVRKEMVETEIEYLFALYQSCEYMESASRAYEVGDYDTGGINIDGQNEQINIHDSKVEDYYNLEAEYQELKMELINE